MKRAKRFKSNRWFWCVSYFEHRFLCSVQLYLETSHLYISPYTSTSKQARSMPPHEHSYTLSKALFDVNDFAFFEIWGYDGQLEDVEKASRWCWVVLETYKLQLVPCWWLKSALSLKTTGNCSAKWIYDCAHNPLLGFPLRYYTYLMVVLRRRTEWWCSHAGYLHGCTGVWAVVSFFFNRGSDPLRWLKTSAMITEKSTTPLFVLKSKRHIRAEISTCYLVIGSHI